MVQDYYRILGLKEDATEGEIKRNYRALAKKYHPDSNPGDKEAEKRFKEAGTAYATLSDREKRGAYDKERAEKNAAGCGRQEAGGAGDGRRPMPGFDFNSHSSDFEQFFGFRPGTSRADEDKRKQNKKTKTNPIDMTEVFERYMGLKK